MDCLNLFCEENIQFSSPNLCKIEPITKDSSPAAVNIPSQQLSAISLPDEGLLSDKRILMNLKRLESKISRVNYLSTSGIKPFMRQVVTTWMLEVCEDRNTEEQIFPTAVDLLDRFLGVCSVDRNKLQLTGAVCLLLASKLRQCLALTVERLSYYTDWSCSEKDIKQWEFLVLSKLGWDLSGVTARDYIDYLIHRLPKRISNNKHLRNHANTFVDLCALNSEFLCMPSSLLAAASLAVAVQGLEWRETESAIGAAVSTLELSRKEVVLCMKQIDSAIMAQVKIRNQFAADPEASTVLPTSDSNNNKENSKEVAQVSETLYHGSTTAGLQTTPTDVTDIEI